MLEEEEDIVVVGQAGDGSAAVIQAERLRRDIVLMDLSMPGVGGIEATRQIRERLPDTRVVVLSMHEGEEYVFRVLEAGASGYVLKRATTTELVLALRAVAAGSTFLSPSISQRAISEALCHIYFRTLFMNLLVVGSSEKVLNLDIAVSPTLSPC